jgi:ATP-dependent RNA helicase RhlB
MKFSELNLHPDIFRGIESAGWTDCTAVQEQTFTYTLQNGRDVAAQSQTGTGKTGAFLISIYQIFMTRDDIKKKALIMAPTRELVTQIEDEAKLLNKFLKFRIGAFYGGVGYAKQDMVLADGCDIYVATPGRLIDYMKSNKIKPSEFGALVIDEADRMFDMGFIPDIRYIVSKMPPPAKRITMLFSATLSPRVKSLAWEYMNAPAEIVIEPDSVTVDNIEQSLIHSARDEKVRLLLGILKNEKPSNAIVFVNTKHKAAELSRRLEVNGYKNEYIIGDLPQRKRQKIIDGIKSGTVNFLIATDVAARGLHVDDLDMVINYDLPEDCENYVHRIGRTARAGKKGKSFSIACEQFVYGLEAIEAYIGKKIPAMWPEEEYLVEDKSHGMVFADDRSVRSRKGVHSKSKRSDRNESNKISRKSNRSHSDGDRPYHKKHTLVLESKQVKKEHIAQKPNKHKFKSNPNKNGSIDQRMEYYKQKYGENFKVSDDVLRQDRLKTRKKTIFKRIADFLFRKK